jgi:hypothetical protein
MPRVKLTKTLIDALPTPQSDIVYWDAALPGFGVKVTPKGRKVFIVLYRTGGAGSKAVQVYRRLIRSATLHHARVAAQKVFAARLDGRDPAAEKREKKRRVVADRVDDLLEAFIDQRLSHDTDTWPQSTAERCTAIAHGAPRAREGDREAITECLNFMSATCCRKISLWTRTTPWARKSPKFAQRDDESSKSETSVVIRGRNKCRILFTVAFEQPGGGGLLWSTFSLILRCRCRSV